jgi:hypothetical protein
MAIGVIKIDAFGITRSSMHGDPVCFKVRCHLIAGLVHDGERQMADLQALAGFGLFVCYEQAYQLIAAVKKNIPRAFPFDGHPQNINIKRSGDYGIAYVQNDMVNA